ncbi:unnamed protein product [Hymenolepis diminuta]|uniref:Annexin n=1 Tax=Hymenolepis diminuta TaxID=6216 RepID=A0A564YP02_HYMDI|nr:unnamed protein product [Hymenolepis diminuta]
MSGYRPPVGFNIPPDQGYPPMGGGYPGYPPTSGSGAYPPQGQVGYPPQGPGYPSGSPGYPPQGQAGYPPQGPGYPGGTPGYSPQGQVGYPPQAGLGYPGGAPSYPPQGQVGNTGYGSSGPSYPSGGATSYPGISSQGHGGPTGDNYYGMGATSSYYTGRPTVHPVANFNPGQDADDLRKAMRGLGTDEARIISILSKRTFEQRVQIATKYMASFGKDLKSHLKSELSGKFEDLVLLSIGTLSEMLATSIYKSVRGAGTNEQLLIQAVIPYPNSVIRGIAPAYQKLYKRDVIQDVKGDTSRDFEKILVAMLQGHREENTNVDMSQATAEAEQLYDAGEKRLGTEEAVFTRIFAQRSFEQIKAINEAYQRVCFYCLLPMNNSGSSLKSILSPSCNCRNMAMVWIRLLRRKLRVITSVQCLQSVSK